MEKALDGVEFGKFDVSQDIYAHPVVQEDGFDPVSRPEHYASGSLECIDWIEAALTEEEFRGYLKGNLLKYFWRHEDKGDPVQDLGKLAWYAEKLRDRQIIAELKEKDAEYTWEVPE